MRLFYCYFFQINFSSILTSPGHGLFEITYISDLDPNISHFEYIDIYFISKFTELLYLLTVKCVSPSPAIISFYSVTNLCF